MTSLKLKAVRQRQHGIEAQSTSFLAAQGDLERIDGWLQVLLDCHAFAIDCCRAQPLDYMEAYAAVASVAYSYAECTRSALLCGFYGNAMAGLRALFSANDIVVDFTLTPRSPRKWLRLRSFQHDDMTQVAKSLRGFFKDSTVRERVSQREPGLSESMYGIASEAVHFTPWGTRFFCAEDLSKPGEFYLQYEPQYHPIRALLVAMLLQAALPHLSGYFLDKCDALYGSSNKRLARLQSRHRAHLEVFEAEGPKRRALLQEYAETQDRLRAGEEFDEVYSDL